MKSILCVLNYLDPMLHSKIGKKFLKKRNSRKNIKFCNKMCTQLLETRGIKKISYINFHTELP